MERTESRTFAAERESVSAAGKARAHGEKISIEQHSAVGLLWFAGWLFTIGFLHLPLLKGVLALIVWPYYLGTTFSSLLP